LDKQSHNLLYHLPGPNQADEQARLVTAPENAAEKIIIAGIKGNIRKRLLFKMASVKFKDSVPNTCSVSPSILTLALDYRDDEYEQKSN
jgi:hypothetical protein